jgi:repressor LexA
VTHGLTARQIEVRDTIARLTAERGYAPTLRELGDALGMTSTNAVNDHLVALERKGAIKRDYKICRSLRVVEVPT